MDKRKVLQFFLVLFLIGTILQQVYIFFEVSKVENSLSPTAKAVTEGAQVRFCLNQQPTLDSQCNSTAYSNDRFLCQVDASDPENYILSYISEFIPSDPELFEISQSGVINFTPLEYQLGNYTYSVVVYDPSTCPNNADSEVYNVEVRCGNSAPVLNNTCNSTVYQNQEYLCYINATDVNGWQTLSFSSMFSHNISARNITLFNITNDGLISFTPGNSQVGSYTYNVTVYDTSFCNNRSTSGYNIEVINVNDAPIFNGPIQNQTWPQGTTLAGFIDLDNFFTDIDGDPLTYSHSINPYVRIIIDSNHEVTLIPIVNFVGNTYVTFVAEDPYGLNATSNDILLTVTPVTLQPQEEANNQGGGGGSGDIPSCLPEWYCRPWGPCLSDGKQERVCIDMHQCDSKYNMPNTTQPCNFVHTCYDGIKGPDEDDVDCGGVCPPCATCYDGIKNGGEAGVDCGGKCRPCSEIAPTNETRIRKDTPLIDNPKEIQKQNLLMIILLIILFLIGIGYLIYRLKPFIAKWLAEIIKNKKKKKEKPLIEEKYKESILEKLAKFEKNISKESTEALIIEFSAISRDYFKNLFNFNREMAYEEIIKEIKEKGIEDSVKEKLLTFFKDTINMEYAGTGFSKKEFYSFVSRLIEIVRLTSISAMPIEKSVKSGKEYMERVKCKKAAENIYVKLSESYLFISKGDINKAYDSYVAILSEFKETLPEDQKKLHPYIANLYSDLRKARKKIK